MQQEDRTRKEKRSCGIAERDREPWLLSDPPNSRSFEGRRMMMMMIMATITMVT
jgi:hypothetical protein